VKRVEQGVPVAGDHHGEFVEFVAHGIGRAPNAGAAGPPRTGSGEDVREAFALGQDRELILAGRRIGRRERPRRMSTFTVCSHLLGVKRGRPVAIG